MHARAHVLTRVHAQPHTHPHATPRTGTHTLTPVHAHTRTQRSTCTLTHMHTHTVHIHSYMCTTRMQSVCSRARVDTHAHVERTAYAFPHVQCTHMGTTCKCVHTCLHASARVHVHRSPMCAMHTHARALMHMCKAHMQMHTHMCESTCTQLTSTCVHAHTCMCMRECAPGGLPCSSPSTSRGAGPPGSGTGTELCAEWSPDQPPPERAGRGRLLEETGVPPAPGGPRHSAPPAQEGCENTDSGPGVRWAMERGTQHPERTRPLLPTSVRPFRPGAGPRRLRSAPPLPRVDAAAALGLAVAQLCSGPF